MKNQKRGATQSRLTIALSLCILSILSTLFIAYMSNRGEKFWTLTHSIAAGARLSSGDLHLVVAKFPSGGDLYITKNENPIGAVALTNLSAGHLLARNEVSAESNGNYLRDISLQISITDLPVDLAPGDLISLYQVHDLRNGEVGAPPQLVIEGLFLSKIGGERSNFSGTTSITVTTDVGNVETILSATTSGRVVVVASHG